VMNTGDPQRRRVGYSRNNASLVQDPLSAFLRHRALRRAAAPFGPPPTARIAPFRRPSGPAIARHPSFYALRLVRKNNKQETL
jgi:hypothetical protein